MKRRHFLKTMALTSASTLIPLSASSKSLFLKRKAFQPIYLIIA
ncbi:MAG: hypothetical protein ACK5KT_13170 [Dysgonomonas sp.]